MQINILTADEEAQAQFMNFVKGTTQVGAG